MYNEYMPPELQGDPIQQDIHRLAQCPAHPEIVWCQHHNGVFRSEDGGHNWRELTAIRPAKRMAEEASGGAASTSTSMPLSRRALNPAARPW